MRIVESDDLMMLDQIDVFDAQTFK